MLPSQTSARCGINLCESNLLVLVVMLAKLLVLVLVKLMVVVVVVVAAAVVVVGVGDIIGGVGVGWWRC